MSPKNDEKAAIELSGAGLWAKITGVPPQAFFLFLIIVMQALLIWMVGASDKDRELRYLGLQQQINTMMKSDAMTLNNQDMILKGIADVAEEQRGTTYVLTLSEQERKNLKLQMPAAIRNRLKDQR